MNLVEKQIKPFVLLEEMAERAIGEHLSKIFIEEKIDAIGRPVIKITKLAHDNPLEFTATVTVFPEATLPDYKALAKKTNKGKKEITVTDEELDKAIVELKKARAQMMKSQGEETNTDENGENKEETVFDSSLSDEEAKAYGPFETAAEFKEKFRENIRLEQEARDREKRRIEMLDAILGEVEIELPEILIEGELENLVGRLKTDITNAGLSFDDYLMHVKKTEDDLRKEFLPDAEKRAKMEFIMMKIGDTEKLSPDPLEVEAETKRLMDMYKGADENRARAYVTHLLSNEAVFKYLESLQ